MSPFWSGWIMFLVVFNLGTNFTGGDAWQATGSNRATVASASGSTITLSAAKLFPFESPGKRFHVVDQRLARWLLMCAPQPLAQPALGAFLLANALPPCVGRQIVLRWLSAGKRCGLQP